MRQPITLKALQFSTFQQIPRQWPKSKLKICHVYSRTLLVPLCHNWSSCCTFIYFFLYTDLPEGASEVLKEQCSVFKRKPLHKAFKEAFLNDIGTYKLVRQVSMISYLFFSPLYPAYGKLCSRTREPSFNTLFPTFCRILEELRVEWPNPTLKLLNI